MIAAMKNDLPQLMFSTFISNLPLLPLLMLSMLLLVTLPGSGDVVATAAALPTQHTDGDLDFFQRLYFRQRPPLYTNDLYVDEFVEVFSRRCTTPSYMLSDDEVDRIIRCDFDPSLKECEELVKTTTAGRVEQKSLTTTTTKTTGTPDISTTRLTVTTQLNDEHSTTEAIQTTTMRAGIQSTTFGTTATLPRTATITSPTTTSTITTTNESFTEDLPFFPTSSADSERSVFPDHKDYYDYDEEGDGK